ncbi:MAG: hypothetical protein NTV74_04350, partial [Euryarchaeota archaeon]|nr:hypothetical protein [Euryarchaeota archaeon]
MVGAMRLNRLFYVIIAVSLLSPLFLVDVTTAEDATESKVAANFDIEFETATELKLDISMDVDEISVYDITYNRNDIQTLAQSTSPDDIDTMGAIKLTLYQLVKKQIETTFENANTAGKKPTYEDNKFHDDFNVNLTSEFFGMNETVNAHNFVNGVLDMGAEVSYAFNLKAEAGWTNTFTYGLPSTMMLKSANTVVTAGNEITWTVDNINGDAVSEQATLSIQFKTPSLPKQTSEDIVLEFELDGRNAKSIDLKTNILAKSVDIRNYSILPDSITNLDFVTSDGIRLFIDNGFTSWDSFYNKTIKPVETAVISTIEKSSLNQTLTTLFSWSPETTTNCSTPYDITNMNKEPPIKAKVSNNDITLKICDVSARALFGLIDSGATANISSTDINFGDKLNETGYPYNGSFYLPDNISLAGEKIYKWNQSKSISGEFKSDDAPEYSNEKIQTIIEIEFSGLDLNLFGLFTGKAELTSNLYMKETSNYYVTTLPDEFTLPDKVKLGYLNSDAFRLCVEENVFGGEKVSAFLDNERELFENRLTSLLPGLKINGLVKRDDFDQSVASWDGEIINMDA